jgi:hypothetical protein
MARDKSTGQSRLSTDMIKCLPHPKPSISTQTSYKNSGWTKMWISPHGTPLFSIEKLYNNCRVKIKIGRGFTEVDYTTGAQQGDNMSPVLFLFVMQAFFDTL